MDFGEDEEYTITLMTPRGVNAFQIPPPATSRGHKAEDWRGKQIWKGLIQVINKGDKCIIQLLNEDKSIFAESRIKDTYDNKIDRCYDSTRFFAILIENNEGKKANIGLGFTDRNDAFDFISSLDDYCKQVRLSKGIDKYEVNELEKDFSLKEGEKIELNIKGVTDKKKEAKKKSGGGLKKLGMPRSGKKTADSSSSKPSQPLVEEKEEGKEIDDIFGGISSEPKEDNGVGLLDF